MCADTFLIWKKFHFENEMSKEGLDAWLRKGATVKYFIECARDFGFLPQACRKKQVRIRYGSRNLDLNERFWSLNISDTDTISVIATEGEPVLTDIDSLCAMGFPEIKAIRALRQTKNNIDRAVELLLSQDSAILKMDAREFLLAHPDKVNDIFDRLEDDYDNIYEFLTRFLLDPFAFPAANISPFAWDFDSENAEMDEAIRTARTYKIAADQGDASAQFLYGEMLINGQEIPQDIEEGTRYLKMAADQGDLGGQMSYGMILASNHNYEEAGRYFKMVAEQGYSEAQYDYAMCLYKGDDGERYCPEISRYLLMSAEQGYLRAQAWYGLLVLTGELPGGDTSQAIHYAKIAADQGEKHGQVAYGLSLAMGHADRTEAIKYFEKAALQGESTGQFLYGLALYTGQGVPKDQARGIDFIKMAGSDGLDAGLNFCGLLLFREGKDGSALLLEAIRHLDFCACYNYTLYLLETSALDDESLVTAFNYLRQLVLTSDLYDFDGFLRKDIGIDSPQRWAYIRAEIAAHQPEAQYLYGKYIYSYKGDVQEAANYFKMAARHKHIQAKFAYAMLILRNPGLGTIDEAKAYLRDAADADLIIAQVHYVDFLLKTEDPDAFRESICYYLLAAEHILFCRRHHKTIPVQFKPGGGVHQGYYCCYQKIVGKLVRASDNFAALFDRLHVLGNLSRDEIRGMQRQRALYSLLNRLRHDY